MIFAYYGKNIMTNYTDCNDNQRHDKQLCQGYNYFCLPKSATEIVIIDNGKMVVDIPPRPRDKYFEHENWGNC